ncbi:MAG: hypothetical protein HZA84_06040 [Thaumarchaeota archaeon]|nr:hypothetical protein [Nitrososphaerota archaeon]
MANQSLLIGVAIGVFFAGLGISYAVFSANQSSSFMHMTPQQMQQMMNNPQTMTQWHQTMINNPQVMNNWMSSMMSNPQAIQQMHDIMMNNPQHMQTMMSMMGPSMMNSMMSNPQTSQQMMGMMMQNQQFMYGMMNNPQFQQSWMGPWMSNNTNWQSMMGSGWMNQGMMGGNMMGSMMGTPITKNNEVLSTINNIEDLLDQVSSRYNDGDKNTALSLATTAYLENYEYVESAIAAKDLEQMEKIELLLRADLRNIIQKDEPAQKIDAKIDSIKTELAKVKKLFS